VRIAARAASAEAMAFGRFAAYQTYREAEIHNRQSDFHGFVLSMLNWFRATMAQLAPATRLSLTSNESGCAWPPTIRSIERQPSSSPPKRVRMLTEAVSVLSPRVPRESTTQLLPSRSHKPWPYPPLWSKCHDMNSPETGSMPIFMVPSDSVLPAAVAVNSPTINGR